ncbi:dockerin type I domain-containing protein [uncultured Ruminococcus sp.]|uniref:dockerin type I domain-containing protein n=1 Tax=uncultured Ruminococcus sp. TaxID=165186 RepID=UPI0025FAFC5E|nr:dockerin type I domain-containing protein [uncultured Ruminococcus sp.]
MKNNDEMYQSVLAKLDAHLERQEQRKKLYLKRIAPVALSLCFGLTVCFAAVKNKKPVDFPNNDNVIVSETTSASVTTLTQTSTETSANVVSVITAEKSATTAKTQTTTAVKTTPNRTAKATGQARTTVEPPTANEAVTTTITEVYEGSVTMKKMIAFLSAMGIAATANPTGVYAANETRIEHIFKEMYYYSLWKDKQWYYDFNADEKFDVKDIFEIELYAEHMDECREKYGYYQTDYKEMFELYDLETATKIYKGRVGDKEKRENEKIDSSKPFIILDVEHGAKDVARYYLYLNGEYPTNDEIREILRDYDFLTIEGPDHVNKFIEFMEKLRNETIDEDYTEEQLKVFRHLDSDETEKDLNGDGEFDFCDSYDILIYIADMEDIAKGRATEDYRELPDKVNERIEQYGDIDLNGKIDEDDFLNLLLYLDKKDIKPISWFNYYYERTVASPDRKNVGDVLKKYLVGDYILGDVDNSGKVNAIDASLVLEHYSKVSTGQSTSLDETQKKSADVNKDGRINAVDASEILSYYAYTATANGDVMTLEEYLQQ